MKTKEETLIEAAQWLVVEVSTHSLECTCGSCAAACMALPYLPELNDAYKEQFKRRTAVAEFVCSQHAKDFPY